MEPIRIVLADLPRMLGDILRASLANEPDVLVGGDTSTLAQLVSVVRQGGVDVVVLGLTGLELPESYYQLFEADARVRILAIADQGRQASLYELRPHRMVIGQGSPQDLVQAIREQVRSVGYAVGARPESES